MSKFRIKHLTRYRYDEPVRDSANQVMLYPIEDGFQETLHHELFISGDVAVERHEDYFGNEVGIFTHTRPHSELVIDSRLVVETKPRAPVEDTMPFVEQWQLLKQAKQQIEYYDFLRTASFAERPAVEKLIAEEQCKECTPVQVVQDLSSYVFKNFKYKKGITTVETTVDEIWRLHSGVCQDFAHMLLVMLRLSEIPCRYVSGYICPDKKDMRGEGATHAWVEAYIPSYGWLGVDPTNNCTVGDFHVRLAVGRNFDDCSPVKGTYRGKSEHSLEVTVSVSYEDGHVSKDSSEVFTPHPQASYQRNSFRRNQEMQQQ